MSVKLRKLPLANGRAQLYLDIHHNGSRKKEYLKLYLGKDRTANKETLLIAESMRAKRQLELASDPYGVIPGFKRDSDFVNFFEQTLQTKGRSWKSALIHLKEFTGGTVKLSAIDESWLERYQDYLVGKVSRNSADTYYAKVKAALKLAYRAKLITQNPADRVDGIGRIRENPRFLTIEEVHALGETSCRHSDIKRAFLFACYTGIRYGDLITLRWENVLTTELRFIQQKTKRPHRIPLSPTAMEILGERRAGEVQLFSLPKSHSNMWKILREWSEAAGLSEPVSFHDARHTFATLLISNDNDLYTVSKLLGHTSLQHTQVYAKVIDPVKQKAVNSLPPLRSK
jgi:integrase